MRDGNAKRYVLKPWEEAVGYLNHLRKTDNGFLVTIAGIDYLLSDFPEELVEKLSGLNGKTIGILKTDNGYVARIIGGRKCISHLAKTSKG